MTEFNPYTLYEKLQACNIEKTDNNGKFVLDHLFCARVSVDQKTRVQHWCQREFGNNWIWSAPIHVDYVDVYFKNPEDAFLFRLSFDTLTTA